MPNECSGNGTLREEKPWIAVSLFTDCNQEILMLQVILTAQSCANWKASQIKAARLAVSSRLPNQLNDNIPRDIADTYLSKTATVNNRRT